MAYGSKSGPNNPKTSTNVPPTTEGKGSGAQGPMPMRNMQKMNAKTRVVLAGAIGVVGAFVFFKSRAVMYRSEDAKRKTAFKRGAERAEEGFEGEPKMDKRMDKNYHVTVERSGGGI